MQKTKKIHHKSNTKHGRKRKIRTIKHPKKNTSGGSEFGEFLKSRMQNKGSMPNLWPPTPNDTKPNAPLNLKNTGQVINAVNRFENKNPDPGHTWNDSRPSSIGSELTMNSNVDTIPQPNFSGFRSDKVSSEEAMRNVSPLPNSSGESVEQRLLGMEAPLPENAFQGPVSPLQRQDGFRGTDVVTEQVQTPVMEAPMPEVSDSAINEELPPGYEKKQAPDGNWYYVNHNDGTTSWTPPVPEAGSPLPNSSGSEATFRVSSEEAGSPLPLVDTPGIVNEPSPVPMGPEKLGTIYIVKYRNNNGVISEKEVFKHRDSEPNTFTRYVFDGNNVPQKCGIPIIDIGEAIKKIYVPYCEEISLAPLGATR